MANGVFADLQTNNFASSCLELSEIAARYKCQYLTVFGLSSTAGKSGGILLFSNWPPGMSASVNSLVPEIISQLDRKTANTILPFNWEFEQFWEAPTDEQLHNLDIIRETGLLSGLVVPVHGGQFRKGAIVLGRMQRSLGQQEIMTLQAASLKAFESRFVAEIAAQNTVKDRFTKHEQECLDWVACGKPMQQLCEHIGLSEHVVNICMESACSKLGAHSRCHAIAKAMTLGILENTPS